MVFMKNTTHNFCLIIAASIILHFNSACSKQPVTDVASSVTSEPAPESAASEPAVPEPEVPEAPHIEAVREVTPLWESKVSAGKEWSAHVDRELDKLGQNLLDVIPADRGLFCPQYDKLSYAQRKQFWTYLLSSMVRFESNFKSQTSYKEAFNDSKGKAVISRGLLQLSIESGNAYGCGFKNVQELHDPLKNLSCGIRILDRWVGRDGRIAGKVSGKWQGGARYWAVLRAGDKTSYKSIVSWNQNLSICK